MGTRAVGTVTPGGSMHVKFGVAIRKFASYIPVIQWNLQTLGAELLSSLWKLSFGGRFEPICNLYPPQDLIHL